MSLTIVQGATAPSIFGTLTHTDGTVFDLTDAAAVRFLLRLAIDRRWMIDAVGDIVTPATGAVRYDRVAGDTPTTGDCSARWRIEWSDGSFEYTDPVNAVVVAAQ